MLAGRLAGATLALTVLVAVDNPVTAPVIRDYLTNLMNNWRTAGAKMAADSFGEENFQIFRRGDVLSAVFRETYHADGPDFNNAYRTFTFDIGAGRRLQLADLVRPGVDPLAAIPPLAQPFLVTALDQAPPPHQPGTYPFIADRWTPDKVYSGGYRARALSGDELILYLPDYPVGHDTPLNYTPGIMQWSRTAAPCRYTSRSPCSTRSCVPSSAGLNRPNIQRPHRHKCARPY